MIDNMWIVRLAYASEGREEVSALLEDRVRELTENYDGDLSFYDMDGARYFEIKLHGTLLNAEKLERELRWLIDSHNLSEVEI